MEWYTAVIVVFSSLILLMLSGMPIALCFIFINVIGGLLILGYPGGLEFSIQSMWSSLATFTIAPIPLFVIMGELMFHCGLGGDVVKIVDQWLGRLPGRGSLIAVISGVILAALTGVSIASVSILGSMLLPQMEKQGYKKSMIFGPILGAGGLAVLIPPSGLAVLLAAIGEISVGKILLAIIGPGLLLAILYSVYIIGRCIINPSLAPAYEAPKVPFKEKISNIFYNILPVVVIIFSVIGFMVFGIATPEEAAASGAIATFFVAMIQRRMSWDVIKKTIIGTIKVTGMIFLIIAGARGFSQILAYVGATQAMAQFVLQLPVHPIIIVGIMQAVILLLGCFMDSAAIILLTMPIFVPAIISLGFDPVWFGAIAVLNIEIGLITPPFGVALYTMKAVAPPKYTMGDIISSAMPFVLLQLLAIILCMIFPTIVMWLPRIK
ncbi:MAG: TRAP transporter large permease subunit [Syntrophorhabdaceae bacterium]|nr:TRAP transporter large permease subunit [Syntrophorhabdaceae bacterium]